MKIMSIVGARPEFIQAAPIRRALQGTSGQQEVWVHTGQHYDYQMSQAFFDDLDIPAPNYNLNVGSGSHGKQTSEILTRLEAVLLEERPDVVIVRGDTNSTVAGALAAAKLQIPSVHIEAGERSYNRHMPEEINRLVTDCLSDRHFCVSRTAVQQLAAEGIVDSVFWVGDVMYDALLQHRPIARAKSTIVQRLELQAGAYGLVTIHRAANTDDAVRLAQIVAALNSVSETIVFPVHPRTRKALAGIDAKFADHVRLIEPVGYFDMMMLEENARIIATDSGGVQREAYYLGIPCLTLRDETEWYETVTTGWNLLIGAKPERIIDAWFNFRPPTEHPPIFGEGHAAQQIVESLIASPIQFGRCRQSNSVHKVAAHLSRAEVKA
ncbi:MAG: UDP-N-acetylglucosamine 2-epimerase (non-hydrolyzing) [Caldilineaceae bacterium]